MWGLDHVYLILIASNEHSSIRCSRRSILTFTASILKRVYGAQLIDGFVIDDALRHSGGTDVSTSESADILGVTVVAHKGTRLGTLNLDTD